MSHITSVKPKFKSLATLEVAANEIGLDLVRDKTRFKWYGRFVGDTRGLPGVRVEDYDRCSHVLRLRDAGPDDYEIGVIEQADGSIELRFDTWGQARLMKAVGGAELNRLRQEYSVAVATDRAAALARAGYSLTRENVGGRVRLHVVKR